MVTESEIREARVIFRIVLDEIRQETEELSANIPILLEKLDKVNTFEDIKKWIELQNKLISGFSHLDVS